MEQVKLSYKRHFTDKNFITSTASAVCFLIVSLVVNFYAGTYAARSASSPVTDIILSNVRAYDLDVVFVYGSIIFFFFIVILGLHKPERIPFILKSIALFVVIRSGFITLTHLGTFPTQVNVQSDLLSMLTFGGDLFFSGHTGLPFLLALIFWRNKIIKNIFLLFSIVFAAVVLLSHMHYTIDVASAFFITYTIFHMAEYLFKKDRQRFNGTIS
jgi:divalent metal cation (Fe/Co/Zn/Cd) transporter